MYRYRTYTNGVTYKSLQGMKHLSKVGIITTIRGYRYRHPSGGMVERVLVKGDKGTARFGGFCWGYGGEGPSGLVRLLQQCGLSAEFARDFAYTVPRLDNPGVDWEITIGDRVSVFYTLPNGGFRIQSI